jgi:hypothetical protein
MAARKWRRKLRLLIATWCVLGKLYMLDPWKLETAALRAALAWVPGVAVLAWFAERALQIPPHGRLGPWVAVLLAGTFATVALVLLYFIMFGIGMDSSPFHAQTPAGRHWGSSSTSPRGPDTSSSATAHC